LPPLDLCTDNAAMIASVGAFRLKLGQRDSWDLNAVPNLPLPQVDFIPNRGLNS
jgi:N6-L-threonylcarbamoyladenine synthase